MSDQFACGRVVGGLEEFLKYITARKETSDRLMIQGRCLIQTVSVIKLTLTLGRTIPVTHFPQSFTSAFRDPNTDNAIPMVKMIRDGGSIFVVAEGRSMYSCSGGPYKKQPLQPLPSGSTNGDIGTSVVLPNAFW